MSMLFALVLFGCSDDGSACQRLSAEPERYSTKSLCEAGQEDALHSDVAMRSDFPTVVSRCVKASAVSSLGRGRVSLALRAD